MLPTTVKKSVKPLSRPEFFCVAYHPQNSNQRKDAYGRVIPSFLKTKFGKWLFRFRNAIEQTFNQWKNNRLD